MAVSGAVVAALVFLGPARSISSSDDSTSTITFSMAPPWAEDKPSQCLTANDAGLVLAKCDGGASQDLLLRDFHFLMYDGKCLEGNSTWAGFATCDQDSPSQWFQLPRVGNSGPISNCWCTGPSDCRMPCINSSGVANGSDRAYHVIGSEPLWFWMSPGAFATPAPPEEPSTTNQAEGPDHTSTIAFFSAELSPPQAASRALATGGGSAPGDQLVVGAGRLHLSEGARPPGGPAASRATWAVRGAALAGALALGGVAANIRCGPRSPARPAPLPADDVAEAQLSLMESAE